MGEFGDKGTEHDTWEGEGGAVRQEDDSFTDQARQLVAGGIKTVTRIGNDLSERALSHLEDAPPESDTELPQSPETPEQ